MFKLFKKRILPAIEQMQVMYISSEKELHTDPLTGIKTMRTIKPVIRKLPLGHRVYEFNESNGETKQITPKVKNRLKVFLRMEKPIYFIEQVHGRMYVPAFSQYKATIVLKFVYRNRKDIKIKQ